MLSQATFCFIVDQFHHPAEIILTLRRKDETAKDVKKFLDKALETLPFRTLYSCVFEFNPDSAEDIFEKSVIKSLIDFPGAEIVKIFLEVDWPVKYFLPRDLTTGEFIDIEKQVKCLEILRCPKPESKYY